MMFTRIVLLCMAFLLWGVVAHAQTPIVDCVPIQGQGWQGCAPVGNNQQPQRPMPPPPVWASRWGALAADDAAGILGVATNMSDENIAKTAAIRDCQSKGGTKCEIIGSYGNGCVALVVGSSQYVADYGPTVNIAIKNGITLLGKGSTSFHVNYSACSYPVRIQ
jgi:hypothetical protein